MSSRIFEPEYGPRLKAWSSTVNDPTAVPHSETIVWDSKTPPNIVTSLTAKLYRPGDPVHFPAIDIDRMKVQLFESTTPGNFHLFIDHPVPTDEYMLLLQVMANCGIVEQGYVDASRRNGFSSLRLYPKPDNVRSSGSP